MKLFWTYIRSIRGTLAIFFGFFAMLLISFALYGLPLEAVIYPILLCIILGLAYLLYRFHVPDPIHFEKSFRMTIDNLGWSGPRYDDYTSVAYWYQSLPSARLRELPEDKDMCMK